MKRSVIYYFPQTIPTKAFVKQYLLQKTPLKEGRQSYRFKGNIRQLEPLLPS